MIIPYRDETPTRKFAFITYLLIGVNLALYVYQILLPLEQSQALMLKYAMIPAVFTRVMAFIFIPWKIPLEVVLSPVSTMFFHGSLFHFVMNMVFLWVFGDNVEEKLGHFRYLIFYFACGIIASFSHYLMNFMSPIPMIGASGAIAGVMGAYLWFFPLARIRCVFIFFPFFYILIPAWIVLVYWIVVQVFSAYINVSMGAGGDVAWFAHIGGFFAGITYVSRKFPKRKATRTS